MKKSKDHKADSETGDLFDKDDGKKDIPEKIADVTGDKIAATERKADVTEGKVDVTEGKVDVTGEKAEVIKEKAEVTGGKDNVTEEKAGVAEEKAYITEKEADITWKKVDITGKETSNAERKADTAIRKNDITGEKFGKIKPDNKKAGRKKTKILKTGLVIVSAVLLLLIGTVYFIIHSYINKMNLVTSGDTLISQTLDTTAADEIQDEDVNTSEPDSPEEDIKALEDSIRKNMEENSTPIKSDKDVLNVLLIGCDTRTAGGGGRSDAMIIVSINKKTQTIVATSLLRDIYLQIPGKGYNRINAAYAYGGAELLMDTIEQNFKIHIDRFASIDFYSFMDIVNAVEGVTLDVTEEEIPIINNYIEGLNKLTGEEKEKDLLTNAGTLHLNGKQALGYARNRYIGTDFERTARQRRVLEQVYGKIKNLNLIELNDLLNTILPKVTTNLTEGEIFSMILNLPAYKDYKIDQWSVPVNGTYSFLRVRGMDVIGIDFDDNITAMSDKIYMGK